MDKNFRLMGTAKALQERELTQYEAMRGAPVEGMDRAGEIGQLMGELHHKADDLEKTIYVLMDKINPILRNEEDIIKAAHNVPPEPRVEPSTTIGRQVEHLIHCVSNASKTLDRVIKRIEL